MPIRNNLWTDPRARLTGAEKQLLIQGLEASLAGSGAYSAEDGAPRE